MAEEGLDDYPVETERMDTAEPAVTSVEADIKLFGKWSCDEVLVRDISLTVRFFSFIYRCISFLETTGQLKQRPWV